MRRGNTIQAAVLSSLPFCSALTRASCRSWMLLLPQPEPVSYGCRARAEERLPVDEQTSAQQVKVNAGVLGGIRNLLHQGFFVPGINANPGILAYVSWGWMPRATSPISARMPLRCTSKRTKWRMATGPSVPKRGPRCARIRSAKPCFPCGACNCTPARGQGGVRKIDSARG